jgi:hypothetical protein
MIDISLQGILGRNFELDYIGIPDYCPQYFIKVVGKSSGELSEGFQLLRLDILFFLLCIVVSGNILYYGDNIFLNNVDPTQNSGSVFALEVKFATERFLLLQSGAYKIISFFKLQVVKTRQSCAFAQHFFRFPEENIFNHFIGKNNIAVF